MRKAFGFIFLILSFSAVNAFAQADKIDAYIAAEMKKSHAPGVSIAVVQNGKTVYAKGYGMANVELSVPATADTEYELLSVGKQFTAVAVMLLVEEGRVALDDKITKYLPDAPAAWSSVTVKQLLSHTSGIPDYTNAPGWRESIRLDRSPQELIKPVMSLPLQFQPGEKWDYSNTNYYLLGMIVEKASGKSYADFLSERIFKPLGMNDTRVNNLSEIIRNRAAGYHWQRDALRNAEYISPTQKWAAGNVVSTANDMAKWAIALDTAKLLKKESLDLMQMPAKLNSGEETKYGFANELDTDHGHAVAGHQGGGLAFNATLLRFPDDKLSVVVLSNLTQAPTQAMARRIASFYLPAISDERNRGIADADPKTTEILRGVLVDAAKGKANAALFAAEAQEKMIPFIERVGPRFLGSMGALQSFVLLEQTDAGANRIRRYRAAFANGASLIWTFELTKDGKILSMEPKEE